MAVISPASPNNPNNPSNNGLQHVVSLVASTTGGGGISLLLL